MSMDILYKREIGIIYDTIKIMTMKLNAKPLWINHVVQKGTETEDEIYVDYWLNQFPSLPQELMIFFHLKDKRDVGFFIYVWAKLLQKKNGEICYDHLIEYINDKTKIREDISVFYLDRKITDLDDFELELSQRSELNGLLRFHLLGFIVNPDRYLTLLKEILFTYYNKTLEIYKDRAESILQYQEKITSTGLYDIISKYHRDMAKENINIENQKIIYSITLFIKKCILFDVEQSVKWCLLGVEYEQQVQEYEELLIDMAALGNAFGDKHRFNIIQLMLKYGEMSVSDFANRLGLAVNSVSYHLDIMRKANLVCCRSKGKSTIYWLNSKVCAIISNILETWSRGGDNVETSMDKAYDYYADSLSNE